MVVKTGLPSFIVTLAMLFMIRGATIGVTRLITGRTQVGGLKELPGFASAAKVFASDIHLFGTNFAISIVWWLVSTLHCHLGAAEDKVWQLDFRRRRKSPGGAQGRRSHDSGENDPLHWHGGCSMAGRDDPGDEFPRRGRPARNQREFYAIIAVVIGGDLLTGGYGSAIGAVLGALIFGMVQQGIIFAGIDADWFQSFLAPCC